MKIVAIDPGIHTGVAVVDEHGSIERTFMTTDQTEVYELIAGLIETECMVVIEDFVGAGPRSTEIIFTLKLIGSIAGICYCCNLPLTIQVPQHRLPFVSEATRRVEKTTSKHAIDALAHALAYIEGAYARGV